jgi:hypothetical protein
MIDMEMINTWLSTCVDSFPFGFSVLRGGLAENLDDKLSVGCVVD